MQKLSNGSNVIPPIVWGFYWWVLCFPNNCLFVSNRLVFTLATTYKHIIHLIPAVYRCCCYLLISIMKRYIGLYFTLQPVYLFTTQPHYALEIDDLNKNSSIFIGMDLFFVRFLYFYYFVSIEFYLLNGLIITVSFFCSVVEHFQIFIFMICVSFHSSLTTASRQWTTHLLVGWSLKRKWKSLYANANANETITPKRTHMPLMKRWFCQFGLYRIDSSIQ